jgi:hypothetical protein
MRRTLTMAALAALPALPFCSGGKPAATPAPVPVVTTVQISPSPLVLAEHQRGKLRATVLDQTWGKMDLPILWQSTDPSVASVIDSAGVAVVTGQNLGTTLISARAHTQVSTVEVKVVKGLTVDVFQSAPAEAAAGPGEIAPVNPTNCFFDLTAVASGGAPGDSATWAASQIEFVKPDMTRMVDTVSTTEMLDRFGSLVIRAGDTLRTRRLVATPVNGNRVVHRIRYVVNGEKKSSALTIACSRSAGPTR